MARKLEVSDGGCLANFFQDTGKVGPGVLVGIGPLDLSTVKFNFLENLIIFIGLHGFDDLKHPVLEHTRRKARIT